MEGRRRRCCIVLFLVLPLFPSLSQQQIDVSGTLYRQCLRNTTTSTLSSTFTSNLNLALRNFTTLSSQGVQYAISTEYAGSSAGQEDTVYAVFQCRRDVSGESCVECLQNATARLPQECPNSVGARIRLEGCFLRYDNQSFFVLDTTFVLGLCNTGSTTDLVTVNSIVSVLQNVTEEAPNQGGFAYTILDGVYGAAQCLGYLSQSECAQCLRDISQLICNLSVGAQLHLASCDIRYETYNFLNAIPTPMLPPPPTPAPAPPGSKVPVIVGSLVAGVVVVVGGLCAMLMWCHKARKMKGVEKLDKETSWSRQLLQSKARMFSLEQLKDATEQFHLTNKLGEGGFGIVYKGTLSSGEEVAVKKLSIGSHQGNQEFLNEVNLITGVQHKNLIRLLGCCVEGPERILVYEYLPNKSLDFFLFEERDSVRLNWPIRYDIVVGMAKGLAYLHEESHIRIIHRDIKPSNILLDDELNAVIADFGLARLVKADATHVNTGVAGTIGYLAPEYALHGALSEKVDVFSFGLVTLEIITGKKNMHGFLLTWVWENYLHEKVVDLVDERLGNAFSLEQVVRLVHVALLCTQENPKKRPTMSMVILWLSGTSDIIEIPTRPTFLARNDSMASTTIECTQLFPSTSSITFPSDNLFQRKLSSASGGLQQDSEVDDPRSSTIEMIHEYNKATHLLP